MKRLLWLLPKYPLPARDGARIASVNLIRELSAKGLKIDLLIFTGKEDINTGETLRELGVSSVGFIRVPEFDSLNSSTKKTFYFKSFIFKALTPLTMARFALRRSKRQFNHHLKRWLKENSKAERFLIYDGLHAAATSIYYGRYIRPAGKFKIIYRAHNVEQDLWFQKLYRIKSLLKRTLFSYQAHRVAIFEDSLLEHIDALAPVSGTDLDKLKKTSKLKALLLPIGFKFPSTPLVIKDKACIKLLFVGRLDWPPNREGLEWFLKETWPRLAELRDDVSLKIAGVGDSSWLFPLTKQERVSYMGEVEDVEPLYAEASAVIIPLFSGSGTRVKAIEAAGYGRAILSTAIGVEGLGLKAGDSYLQAEGLSEWLALLSSIDHGMLKNVSDNAFQYVTEHFSAEKTAKRFLKLLRSFY